jgi:AcrR family transcriptional regulator
MARPKAPTFELQRAAMLQAAAGLFAREGFHHASMAAIAAECGVSKALLYHYYRDKAQILFDIADCHIERLLAIVDAVEAQQLEPDARLRLLILRFMQTYAHAQAQHLVLVQDVKFLAEPEREQVLDKERRVVHAFARAIAAVQPRMQRNALRVPLAMLLFGMMNWTFTWLRADGPLSYEDMAEVAADVFLQGIGAQSPDQNEALSKTP